jgi:hypothetical protein
MVLQLTSPSLGSFECLIDDSDAELVLPHKWYPIRSSRGGLVRAVTTAPRKRKTLHLSRLILDAPAGLEVDHINGNTLDNRRENLRLATRSQNEAFKAAPVGASGVRNVYFVAHMKQKPWRVLVMHHGKNRHFGYYATIEEAAVVAKQAFVSLFGEEPKQAPNPSLCKACHRETPEEYREPVPGGYFCRNCVEDWAEDGE